MQHLLTDEEAQEYIDLGATPNDIVRLRWPDATDEFASYVLWEGASFPMTRGVHDLVDQMPEVEDWVVEAATHGSEAMSGAVVL